MSVSDALSTVFITAGLPASAVLLFCFIIYKLVRSKIARDREINEYFRDYAIRHNGTTRAITELREAIQRGRIDGNTLRDTVITVASLKSKIDIQEQQKATNPAPNVLQYSTKRKLYPKRFNADNSQKTRGNSTDPANL